MLEQFHKRLLFRPAHRCLNSAMTQNKNAASLWLSGVLCLSDRSGQWIMPRTPSLELSVLRNGGGQKPVLANSVPIVYDLL
jgi:hypothetical protein